MRLLSLRMFPVLVISFYLRSALACPWDDPSLTNWTDPNTWPSGMVPGLNESVVIPFGYHIRLDGQPPRIESIHIEHGGSLVWGDVDDICLETRYILVEGEFHIGAEDCRFEKTGKITLYGKSDDSYYVEGFGKKFIGVPFGGTLDIHGEDKLSWTKLTKTVGPATKDCGMVFDSRESSFSRERGEGIHAIVWNQDGTLFDHAVFSTAHKEKAAEYMERFVAFVQELPDGLVAAFGVFEDLGRVDKASLPWENVYTTLENLGAVHIRHVKSVKPYVVLVITGNPSSIQEAWWHADEPSPIGVMEVGVKLAVETSKLTFLVRSIVSSSSNRRPTEVRFRIMHTQWESPVINLMHNVSSWRPGDQIIVVSTDYEWRQSEVKTIVECPDCSPFQVKVEGEFEFTHFGEVTYGIDERGEVGLLTRNFKVMGEMEEECYITNDKEKDLCEKFDRDMYGGHIMVLLGGMAHFESFEVRNMGQQTQLGAYPIHFHMCDDVLGMYVKQMSVVDTYSRCITIHGTDNLLVENNVCYLHYGHGIFLEDSAEQHNVFRRNLVLGTKHGTLTPVDRPRQWCVFRYRDGCDILSSFWITHPNNYFTENVAAGSDTHGYAFTFADVPLGPSYERQQMRGLFQPYSTRYIKVAQFEKNTAHSNYKAGLWFDDLLSPGDVYKGRELITINGRISFSHYSAREPPTEDGVMVDTVFSWLTFYKNGRFDAWVRGGNIFITNSSFGDTREGYTGAHVDYDESGVGISHSLFIGETDNVGEPYFWSPSDGLYESVSRHDRPTHYFTRSASMDEPEFPMNGVTIYQGPVIVDNCYFDKYYNYFFNDSFVDGNGNRNARPGSAFSFSKADEYPTVPTSGVKNIKYGFCDGENNSWYVFMGNYSTRLWKQWDGDFNVNFRDIDGSVTGIPDVQVVHDWPFFTGEHCLKRPNWHMAVCPYNYLWLELRSKNGVLRGKASYNWPVMINRDDHPDWTINLKGQLGAKYVVRTNMSYTIRFNQTLGDVPTELRVKALHGPTDGDTIRLAFCFPKTTTKFQIRSKKPRIDKRRNFPIFVNSLEELDADTTQKAFFWDNSTGFLYMKLTSDKSLDSVEQFCPGNECKEYVIVRLDGHGPAECDGHPEPLVAGQNFDQVAPPPPCRGHDSPEGLGAPVEPVPPEATPPSNECPAAPIGAASERRLQPYELRGCFERSEVESSAIRLYASMTLDLCVKRCARRGYHYAGLSSGTICKCGEIFSASRPRSASDCNVPCSGDPTQICGGKGATAVYATGLPPPPAPRRCGPDERGVVIEGKCYYLSLLAEEFPYAARTCLELGGELTRIDSQKLLNELAEEFASSNFVVWIGGVWYDGEWTYMDRTPLNFTNWMEGADKVDKPRFLRLRADKDFLWDSYGYWDRNVALCTLSYPWVYDREGRRCGLDDAGYRVSENEPCYKMLTSEVTHQQAVYNCHHIGGKIAPAYTIEEKSLLDKFVYRYADHVKFWVAGDTSSDKKGLGYDNRFFPDIQEFSLKSKLGVICQLDEMEDIKDCPTGWIPDDYESCYLALGEKTNNFITIGGLCSSSRSHILRIDSAEENEFIVNTLPNQKVWLDLHYLAQYDSFLRQDGYTSHWSNYKNGDPRTHLADGACVLLDTSTGYWQNKQCDSGQAMVVCEMEAIEQSIISMGRLPPFLVQHNPGGKDAGVKNVTDEDYDLEEEHTDEGSQQQVAVNGSAEELPSDNKGVSEEEDHRDDEYYMYYGGHQAPQYNQSLQQGNVSKGGQQLTDESGLQQRGNETLPQQVINESVPQQTINTTIQHPPANESLQKPAIDDVFGKVLGNESVQQPPIDEGFQQPILNESVQQPPIDEGFHQPILNESVQQPPIDEGIHQPILNESVQQPPIDEGVHLNESAQQPILNESVQQPHVDKGFQQPILNESAQQPTIYESFHQPILNESVQQPPIDEGVHQAILNESVQQPPIDEGFQQPILNESVQQPPIDEGFQQPIQNESVQHPPIDEGFHQPILNESVQQPPIDEDFQQPILNESVQQPPIDEGFQQPILNESVQQPSIDEGFQQPILNESVQEPPIDEGFQQPILNESAQQPSIDEGFQQPILNESVQQPPIDEGVQEPLIDEGVQEPPIDEGVQEPPINEGVQEPPIDEGVQQPPIDEGVQQPPIDEGVQQPPIDGGVQQPPIDEGVQQPPIDEGVQEPLMDEGVQQPILNKSVQQAPIDEGVQEPIINESVKQPPLDEGVQEPIINESVKQPTMDESDHQPLVNGSIHLQNDIDSAHQQILDENGPQTMVGESLQAASINQSIQQPPVNETQQQSEVGEHFQQSVVDETV